jgi:hypothetical protein
MPRAITPQPFSFLTNSSNQDSTVITNSPSDTDAPPQSNAITIGYYKGLLFGDKYRTLDVHFDAVRIQHKFIPLSCYGDKDDGIRDTKESQ